MASSKFNSKSPTIRRILREAQEISTSPSPDYTATPLESDLFEWHFTLKGPPESAYAGGIYHGRIVLPPTYPLRPPSFRFLTPSGRFEANREICLSISGHHEETWQPAWGVRTALVALRSFMETDPKGQLGGLETPDSVRRRLAGESVSFRCGVCARTNAEIIAESEAAAADAADAEGGSAERKEVEVPPELKMGWRDEMGKVPTPESSSGGDGGASDAVVGAAGGAAAMATAAAANPVPASPSDPETAELAEGFVQTAPLPPVLQVQAQAQQSPHAAVPQPTRTVPLAPIHNPHAVRYAVGAPQMQMQVQQQPMRHQARRRSEHDGVPVWVDRAIVMVAVLLLAMFAKMLFK